MTHSEPYLPQHQSPSDGSPSGTLPTHVAPLSADASAHGEAVAGEAQQNDDGKTPPKKRLSAAMGAACLAGGVLGLAVPGLPGWPLLIIGASVLAPRVPVLSKANDWMKERFPDAHAGALHFEHRFLTDLEKRYPDAPASPSESAPYEVAEAEKGEQKQA